MKDGIARCLVVLSVASFAACSVKEDRSACPSECEVFFCGPDQLTGKDLEFGVWNSRSVLHDSFEYEGPMQKRMYYVPRSPLVFFAGTCRAGTSAEYRIAEGSQCDSLYTVSRAVRPYGEFCSDTLVLHKDFATVNLSIETAEPGWMDGYHLRIMGNTAAYSLKDAEPVAGTFRFMPRFNADACATFRVPRQVDDSLVLELLDAGSEEVALSFGIGMMLKDKGYSWQSRDLEDIDIRLSLDSKDVHLDTLPWYDGGVLDISF